MKRALIVVDFQYDFVNPKGNLYVPGSEQIITYVNNLVQTHRDAGDLVIATRDWHPINHCSFKQWPEHCIQQTPGSALLIDEKQCDLIISKGHALNIDSYSGFYDLNGGSNGLHEYLQMHHITSLVIVGVALDICVNATLNDAIKLGYHVTLDLNGCRGIKNELVFND